jgi:phosphonate transport system substrate-binding protein
MRHRRLAAGLAVSVASALAVLGATAVSATAAKRVSCPGGKVNFGVEPYDAGAKFTAAYKALTGALSTNLGCPVNLIVSDNYTAEVEAMKAGKLDVGEFGPLGYIFAHSLAGATPVAVFADKHHKPVTYTAAIWVPKDSPIQTVAQLKGHTVAFSDPGSTSGNLMPRYAIIQAGLNPDRDVKIKFAGSHPASLLALVNGKVDAGEVNSQQQATAVAAHQFDPAKFRVLWRSKPIQNDPITVRSSLGAGFVASVKDALLKMSPAQLKLVDTELGVDSGPMVAAKDSFYDPIRALVNAEHLKITQIG